MENNNRVFQNWQEILFNKDTELNYDDFIKKIKAEFSEEYKRIKSENKDIFYASKEEKSITGFIDDIPVKLKAINTVIRPFKDKFYSCIITDEEVDLLANMEHNRWLGKLYSDGWQYGEIEDSETQIHTDLTNFAFVNLSRLKFYRELIYTIPVILNRCGYEVLKPSDQDFIKDDIVENLARAFHERYRLMMKDMDEKSRADSAMEKLYIVNSYNRQYASMDFDQLPDDIKSSNLDSAHHIATKLLAIGYTIEKANRNTDQALLFFDETQIETIAKLEHERWSWEKRLKGFTFSSVRNDDQKKHPCLVPYNELPEMEKEKDRVQVRFYPHLLHDINYTVVPLSPEQLQNLSYIPAQRVILQESLINVEKALSSLNQNDLLAKNKSNEINNHLKETLDNISDTIKEHYAASLIQQCIMPSKLYFRTCLPESFVLFKPKDILSGDFYFISKVNNFTIFAAADCTGHGTSGAMLSMICSNFLDQAVNDNHITDPSMILSFVYKKLVSFMKRHEKGVVSDNGMEIAICTLIPEKRTVFYAGINRPLYLFRNGALEMFEAQKVRAGDGYDSVNTSIKPSQQINLQKGDTFYVFSDGYVDQMGGNENKKFMTSNFKKLLEKIQPNTLLEQYEILNRTIEEWKGTGTDEVFEQIDDILVIGVRM